ncbi:MAG TPA: HAMP domain-containing sensor histidine kinase [Solirubrobacteraceae bacterium]|nr:HAMP domain-containing sensor histidine kinase [Solirubrobacteraceae bacterium]
MAFGRPSSVSLRWKLLAALVATSGLTLLAAGFALVPQLQHRLTQDRLTALRQAARSQRASLAELGPAELRPGTPQVARFARRLQRSTGARVALFTRTGRALVDTDPDRRAPVTGQLERGQDAVLARQGASRASVINGEAVVVRQESAEGGVYTLVLRKQLNDTRAALGIVRRGLPLALAIALAIAIIAGLALSYGLVRRLERLRQGAQRLGDEGIDEPLPTDSSTDEVGQVARALETMRARLSADEHARQAFLSTASHELRTPVASLQGTLELLDENLAGEHPDLATARRRAAAATRQSRQLARLTTDLLDLSRLDGEIRLRREPLELLELATAVASEFEARASEAGVAIEVDRGGPRTWALADAPAVARIVRVLLDNALRYGAERATVTIGTDAGRAWLLVSDDGPGVADAERERIFGRFERGEAGQSSPGFGLGLAISRELARRMDGELALLAVRPGSSFELTLPSIARPVG